MRSELDDVDVIGTDQRVPDLEGKVYNEDEIIGLTLG